MPTWIPAVVEVAREAALAEDRERVGWSPDDERLPPFAYRWEHVQQVVRNGRWLLAQLPEADEDIVLAACWLHDARKQARDHAQRGAAFARHFLPQTDFPDDKVEAVAEAIAVHQGLFRPADDWSKAENSPFRAAPPLRPLEAAILWDADKLTKIGPVALLHFVPYHLYELAQRGESVTTDEFHARNQRWLETVAPRMLASFNTRPAHRRALHLHAAYEHFWLATQAALHTPPGA